MAVAVGVSSSGGRGGILGWAVRQSSGHGKAPEYLVQYEIGGELRPGPRSMARMFPGPGEAVRTARVVAVRDGRSYTVEEWSGSWASPVVTPEGDVSPFGDFR